MVRTNEGGSVLSFAVVGAILAILLVGGVAVVRQQFINSQKAAPTSRKVAQPSDNKDKTTAPAASSSDQTPANSGQAPSDSSTSTPAPQAATTPGSLPHTGPVETLTTIVALGLLTASSTAYLRSRRYQLPTTSI